jgi:CHASE3 domain sensor protein
LAANRLVLLAAVPLFLVLAVVAYITIQFAANERDAQAWVRHTYQVMETFRAIQDDVQTAETGARGYLISHDPVFLNSYRSFAAKAPSDLKALRGLTTDNPDQQRRADRLQKLIATRIAGLDIGARNIQQTNALSPPEQLAPALARARQQMGAIRDEVTAGLAEEQSLLASRDAERRNQETLEIAFAIGAGVLTLGILLIAAAMLVRNNISLGVAERARANEAAILQATLDTVRDGVAYFTSEGTLCAFNAGFFKLLELPAGWQKSATPISRNCRLWGRRFCRRLKLQRAR